MFAVGPYRRSSRAEAGPQSSFSAISLQSRFRTSSHRWSVNQPRSSPVSKRLGHSQLAITADTSLHVLPVLTRASSEARSAGIPRQTRPRARELGPATKAVESDGVPTAGALASRAASLLGPYLQVNGPRRKLPRLDLNQKPCD